MSDFFDYIKNEYLEELYDLEDNSASYCEVQGELITEIAGPGLNGGDHRIDENDALEVARYLNTGDVHAAEKELEELLE